MTLYQAYLSLYKEGSDSLIWSSGLDMTGRLNGTMFQVLSSQKYPG